MKNMIHRRLSALSASFRKPLPTVQDVESVETQRPTDDEIKLLAPGNYWFSSTEPVPPFEGAAYFKYNFPNKVGGGKVMIYQFGQWHDSRYMPAVYRCSYCQTLHPTGTCRSCGFSAVLLPRIQGDSK